ncbi:MAG TPA: hypothetical protein VGG82_07695 [Casimicrobiaceae bacterium]
MLDPDENYTRYLNVRVGSNQTIKKLAAQRGEPNMAAEILKLNKGKHILPIVRDKHHKIVKRQPGLRSVTQKLRDHATVRIPGTLKSGDAFSVLAGDNRPKITAGYAKYDTVDVPSRIGLSRFDGYDPVAMEIAIQFEAYTGDDITWVERDIQKLERMAGRGQYPGAAIGPPSVIRLSVSDNQGNIVPLIPTNYQWTPHNTHAPLYRITGIVWADGAQSDDKGRRTRQLATVTVTQYTPLIWTIRSASQRSRTKRHH